LLIWESFLIAFSVLLPLINPFGSALVFLGLVGEAPPKVYRSLARRIAINNIIFLAIIEVLGATILKFFGISLPIVQLSGGIVIAAMGWSVLNEKDEHAISRNEQEETAVYNEIQTQYLEQKAFYPYTFPITSGPGTLVAILTLTAHISNRAISKDILSHVGVLLAMHMPQKSPRPSRHPPRMASCGSLRLSYCALASRSRGTASLCCLPI
jgi:multiple antibiotic resistance protein